MIAPVCPTVPTGPGFLAGVLRSIDCLSASTLERSFEFLSGPGAVATVVLTSAVTVLIVFIGFRLLFDRPLDFGDLTSSAIKVGIALALVTSWPVVSKAIVGPVINGPAELTTWTGLTAQLPERLGAADEGIGALISWGTGRNDIRAQRTANGDYAANESSTVALSDAFAFGGGRTALLVGTIGSLGLLKLLSAILLGLAPMFAGFLLFERTQGILVGWIRTLLGLLFAGAAANLLFAVELAILEPWLTQTIADRQANMATPSAAGELLGLTLSFSLIVLASTLVIIRTFVSLEVPSVRISHREREPDRDVAARDGAVIKSSRASVSNDNNQRTSRLSESLQRIDAYRATSSIRSTSASQETSVRVSERSAGSAAGDGGARRPRRTLVSQRRDSKR